MNINTATLKKNRKTFAYYMTDFINLPISLLTFLVAYGDALFPVNFFVPVEPAFLLAGFELVSDKGWNLVVLVFLGTILNDQSLYIIGRFFRPKLFNRFKSLRDYSQSKQVFAKNAKQYFKSNDVRYKLIVPSAFKSPIGKGPLSAKFAADYSMFFIRREYNFILVT